MSIDRVVVNASPLICLFKAGLHGLLPNLFQQIVVPEAVMLEVTAAGKHDFPADQVRSQQWLQSVALIPLDLRVAAWDLGKGENEVLSFALQNPEFRTVLDDQEARRCAATLGCKVIGTAGILVLAKRIGMIPSLKEAFGKLQAAGLWLSPALVSDLCESEGE
jgi:predicted nucleic acid-binding protein